MTSDHRNLEQRVQNSIVADVMGLGVGATSPDWAIRTAIADELSRDGCSAQQTLAMIQPIVAGAVSAAQLVAVSPMQTSKAIMQGILAHADRRQQNFEQLVERTCNELVQSFAATRTNIELVSQGAANGASVVASRWKFEAARASELVTDCFDTAARQTASELN